MNARARPDDRYLHGLQAMRGIAAMMVVFHHARHFVGSGLEIDIGARGVEIFFAISGLVMMQTTQGASLAQGLPLRERLRVVADFLRRRVARVAPLYWVALPVFVTATGTWGVVPGITLLKDALFIPHWSALDTQKVWPTLVAGWSLNIEMLFYLIFGCALALGRLGAWATCATIVGLCALRSWADPRSAFEVLYTNPVMLCFVAGILLYPTVNALREVRVPGWIAIGVIALGFWALAGTLPIPDVVVLPFASAMIVGGAAFTMRRAASTVAARVLHRLGDASYSIYLFHGVALILMRFVLDRLGVGAPSNALVIAQFGAYLFAGAFAGVVVHALVERPLLAGARSILSRADSGRTVFVESRS